ncbi:MAG: Uma2 family endonuclease [Roseiflexaceae bacterium]
MATTLSERPPYDIFRHDRPGWIPEWVGDDWDPHPYAYQTREELMPAGHAHGLYIQMLAEMLKPLLERLGMRLFIDVFIFYRDWEGRKQRIAPDALFAPGIEQARDESLHKYDLDQEPVPLCAIEVISPASREADLQGKRLFYAGLGIQEYLVLDVEDEQERLLPQIGVSLWRMEQGIQLPVTPDNQGFLLLESIGVRLRADGRKLIAFVATTGEPLLTSTELVAALEFAEQARLRAEQARLRAEQARLQAEQHAAAESAARQLAEDELAQLREELARLRRTLDNQQ